MPKLPKKKKNSVSSPLHLDRGSTRRNVRSSPWAQTESPFNGGGFISRRVEETEFEELASQSPDIKHSSLQTSSPRCCVRRIVGGIPGGPTELSEVDLTTGQRESLSEGGEREFLFYGNLGVDKRMYKLRDKGNKGKSCTS